MGGMGGGGGGGGGGGMNIFGSMADIYNAYDQNKATNKAIDAQKAALIATRKILGKELDPDRLDGIAVEYDTRQIDRRQEFLQKYEPELYKLRNLTKQQLLDYASRPKETDQSHLLASKLFNEIKDENPAVQRIKDSLLSNAEKDLKSGATLPPEFQNDLVRAGLEKGSQGGIGMEAGAIGGGIARFLGLGGEQIRQSRNQEAVSLTNAAQNLTTARTNILASVFPKLRDLETADRNESVQNYALTNVAAPDIGINGDQAINAHLAKTNARTGYLNDYAGLKGQRIQADSQFRQGLATSSAAVLDDALNTALSVYTGGASGMLTGGAGGGGGGIGAALGGMMQPSKTKGVTDPSKYTGAYMSNSNNNGMASYLQSYDYGIKY